jgi:cell division protein FtsL
MALRGRHWFFFWLAAACTALWLVVWRQTDSFRLARELGDVRTQRTALEGRLSDYERRIRSATSREQLMPRVAARLGLRQARDSEIIRLPAPPDSGAEQP